MSNGVQDTIDSTLLNDNDVLSGRGRAASMYIGNRRFRQLVRIRKQEYMSISSNKAKRKIAAEVFSEIHRRGGRFLTPVSNHRVHPTRNVLHNGIWREASKKTSLEKCKQTLRELSSIPENYDSADFATYEDFSNDDASHDVEQVNEDVIETTQASDDQEDEKSQDPLSPLVLASLGMSDKFYANFDGTIPADPQAFDWGDNGEEKAARRDPLPSSLNVPESESPSMADASRALFYSMYDSTAPFGLNLQVPVNLAHASMFSSAVCPPPVLYAPTVGSAASAYDDADTTSISVNYRACEMDITSTTGPFDVRESLSPQTNVDELDIGDWARVMEML